MAAAFPLEPPNQDSASASKSDKLLVNRDQRISPPDFAGGIVIFPGASTLPLCGGAFPDVPLSMRGCSFAAIAVIP
jgi:hypothetical protein